MNYGNGRVKAHVQFTCSPLFLASHLPHSDSSPAQIMLQNKLQASDSSRKKSMTRFVSEQVLCSKSKYLDNDGVRAALSHEVHRKQGVCGK